MIEEEEREPYLVESKENDKFIINVKGTKSYRDLQDKMNKVIEYIDTQVDELDTDSWHLKYQILTIKHMLEDK